MGLSTFEAFKHLQSDLTVILENSQLPKLQSVLLGILDDIVTVCDENDISYSLSGGTCLGAIRHQGFIPWDDDIDINMTRKDYDKFRLHFEQYLSEKYWLQTPENTDNYGLLLARVRLKGTVLKTRDDFFNNECGAFVDIFILENTFDNTVLRTSHGIGCLAFGFLLSCRKFWRDRNYMLALAEGNPTLLNVFRFKIAVGFITSVGSVNFWTRTANKWNRLCKNEDTSFVTIPAGRKHFFGELYNRKDMCCTIEKNFEGRTLKCPENYQNYLTALYGDYLKIPKESEREAHVFFGEIVI